jgi:7-cyano-7-deazaguanine synthase in queuosine biosynthesis
MELKKTINSGVDNQDTGVQDCRFQRAQDYLALPQSRKEGQGRLVLWSGGIESTSVLHQFLAGTEERVVAHHLVLDNTEGRARAELRAIERLLPELRKIRDFEYSSSEIRLCSGELTLKDREIYHWIGYRVMQHHHCRTMYKGYSAEDQYQRVTVHTESGSNLIWVPYDSVREAYYSRARMLEVLLEGQTVEQVMPYYESAEWTRAQHWQSMGALAELTWSCRRPQQNYLPCERCHSCWERSAARTGSSIVPEIAERIENENSLLPK